MWLTLLQTAVPASVAIAAVAWLAKALVGKLIDQDLNNAKHKLELAQIEFEANLNQRLKESEIKFSSLHRERAEKISKVYGLLFEIENAIVRLSWPGNENAPERLKELLKGWEELRKYFGANRLFIPSESCSSIESFCNKAGMLHDEATYYTQHDSKSIQQRFLELFKVKSEAFREIVEIKRSLERDFRRALGEEVGEPSRNPNPE